MPWQTTKLLKSRIDKDQSIPDPSESSVHGKEIHIAKQQQTQKEVIYNKFSNLDNLLTMYLLSYFSRHKVTQKFIERLLPLKPQKWNIPVKTKKE